jgi:hypothetical protein
MTVVAMKSVTTSGAAASAVSPEHQRNLIGSYFIML